MWKKWFAVTAIVACLITSSSMTFSAAPASTQRASNTVVTYR